MPYLLHEHPMALLAPANHPRIMECEKTQMNHSFESILDEDVPYSIVVKNITAEETTGICSKCLQCIFLYIYIYILYIQLQYPKKLEATFLY